MKKISEQIISDQQVLKQFSFSFSFSNTQDQKQLFSPDELTQFTGTKSRRNSYQIVPTLDPTNRYSGHEKHRIRLNSNPLLSTFRSLGFDFLI